ncbi:MAG: nuclear transport factor 2 family protein [Actinomycetota bacterium]|nr:nuclear transport factor 2 family protein [Actinomycetota bacterium]
MGRADADLVRDLYAALGRGDMEAVLGGMAPDVVFETTVETHHGRDGVRAWLRATFDALDDFQAVVERVLDAGDGRVLVDVYETARGRSSGLPLEHRFAHLWTVRDGRAVRFQAFTDRAEARRVVGLG